MLEWICHLRPPSPCWKGPEDLLYPQYCERYFCEGSPDVLQDLCNCSPQIRPHSGNCSHRTEKPEQDGSNWIPGWLGPSGGTQQQGQGERGYCHRQQNQTAFRIVTRGELWSQQVDHDIPRNQINRKPIKFLLGQYYQKSSRSSEPQFNLNHKNRVIVR